MRCIKCGKELRIAAEQVGYDNNGLPIFHRIGYCDECKLKTDIDSSSNNKISNDISKLKTTNIVLIVISAIFNNIITYLIFNVDYNVLYCLNTLPIFFVKYCLVSVLS